MGSNLAELREVDVNLCVVDSEFNTRKRGLGDLTNLRMSIAEVGVLEPLLGREAEDGKVEIYAGFRRYAAAVAEKRKTVPVKIAPADDRQMLIFNVSENIHRQELNPIDEALAIQRLQETHSLASTEVCRELGIKKTRFEARCRLLTLSPAVRDAIHTERISLAAGLEIDKLPKDRHNKFIETAEDLTSKKLATLIQKELDKIQKAIAGTEPKEPKDDASAAVTENLKLIKRAGSVMCDNLGYSEDESQGVKNVNFRVLDPDDILVVARLFDGCADLVEPDIQLNEKAGTEIVALVESQGGGKLLDADNPMVRAALIKAISDHAKELAKEASEGTGRRAKVTYALAKKSMDEFFITPPKETV